VVGIPNVMFRCPVVIEENAMDDDEDGFQAIDEGDSRSQPGEARPSNIDIRRFSSESVS
jgi:hypothetical protein